MHMEKEDRKPLESLPSTVPRGHKLPADKEEKKAINIEEGPNLSGVLDEAPPFLLRGRREVAIIMDQCER